MTGPNPIAHDLPSACGNLKDSAKQSDSNFHRVYKVLMPLLPSKSKGHYLLSF